MNYLSKRDIAIVSEIAGTTRDVIEAHLNIDGYPVVVSDTAGIRVANNEIEKGIKLALDKADSADLNTVLEPKSVDFTRYLDGLLSKNAIILVNKSDLELISLIKKLKNTIQFIFQLKKKI